MQRRDTATGVCWDNAAAESFFSSLKNEMYHHQAFTTRQRERMAVSDYIEVFYNRIRSHSTIGYRTPTQEWDDHTTTSWRPAPDKPLRLSKKLDTPPVNLTVYLFFWLVACCGEVAVEGEVEGVQGLFSACAPACAATSFGVQAHQCQVDALQSGLLTGEVPAGLDRTADAGVDGPDGAQRTGLVEICPGMVRSARCAPRSQLAVGL